MLPMDLPGIDVRPIRQMSGGASFNEVFFDDVRSPTAAASAPSARAGRWRSRPSASSAAAVGDGDGRVGGSWPQLLALARWVGATDDPVVRQQLARSTSIEVAGHHSASGSARWPGPASRRARGFARQAAVDRVDDADVGRRRPPARRRALADTGEWGTYRVDEHVLGAPGYRIAGGSDEIQRNIIGERVLGLPPEPRPTAGSRSGSFRQ